MCDKPTSAHDAVPDAGLPDRASVSRLVAEALPALQQVLAGRVSVAAAVREHHGHGEGVPDSHPPDAVVFPASSEEVAEVVRIAAERRIPLIPFGTGTSLEGHVNAVHGGICVDLSGMNAVLEINPASLDCRVQAGVTRTQLNEAVRSEGLFFPIDPGADASLGGMAATRASGTAAVRYGTMRDAVLGLTVVTAAGEIVRTGTRARKTAAGLDLTRLFVGSEGILGFITEVQLRLWGLPEDIRAAVVQFPDIDKAMETVVAVLQMGIPVARIELLDDVQMDACKRYSRLDEFEVLPTLMLEFHGGPAAVQEQVEAVEALAADNGGSRFAWAARPEDRSRLWKARHENYHANTALRPGWKLIGTDACVPIGALADCIRETKADVAASGMLAPLIGHVGDGNFHLAVLFDPERPGHRDEAEALAQRVSERAIRYGGTCTGEHGIGLHRQHQMALEHPQGLLMMRTIKQALDPLGIMNPGKMIGG